jgi:hypothetical protein
VIAIGVRAAYHGERRVETGGELGLQLAELFKERLDRGAVRQRHREPAAPRRRREPGPESHLNTHCLGQRTARTWPVVIGEDAMPQPMERAVATPPVAADAPGVTEVVAALESSLYGPSTFSQADLDDEWAELDLERDTRVVRDGGRIVGYGAVRERGELWRVEG